MVEKSYRDLDISEIDIMLWHVSEAYSGVFDVTLRIEQVKDELKAKVINSYLVKDEK